MKYCIGFDIGGTKCAVSLGEIADGNIRIIAREETPTTNNPQETLGVLAPYVKTWVAKTGAKTAGISCGGPLNSKTGVIVCPPNLAKGWHGFAIVEYVQKEFGLSAKLQNDANACAVAEWKFGAGKGTQNMIFFTFGTGLGAGLILDGRLYSGTNDNAGEAGHIRLAKNGPIGFGKYGSFEGFCSGGGITRLAQEMALRCKKIPLCIENMGGMSAITTKKLSEAAKAGDAFARRVFLKSGEMLGKGLSIMIDVLNPEKIVLGGVFMRSSELLIPSMKKVLVREALGESLSVCEIVPAELSENIGDVAALAIADM
ncbi:MAG: ROK family protein [Clostridiales bacterium]|nr:ROK family protein [Clostridiales bacterium]